MAQMLIIIRSVFVKAQRVIALLLLNAIVLQAQQVVMMRYISKEQRVMWQEIVSLHQIIISLQVIISEPTVQVHSIVVVNKMAKAVLAMVFIFQTMQHSTGLAQMATALMMRLKKILFLEPVWAFPLTLQEQIVL